MALEKVSTHLNPIQLWLAIHGGCWPVGPGPGFRHLTPIAHEIMASLALLDVAGQLGNEGLSKQLKQEALGRFNAAAKELGSI